MEGNVIVATTLNGIKLQDLSHILVLKDSSHITISQDITIHSPSFLGGLQVLDGGSVVVDGVDLQDIVLRDTNAVITGELCSHFVISTDCSSFCCSHIIPFSEGSIHTWM